MYPFLPKSSIVYIAGPYSNDPENNTEAAAKVAATIAAAQIAYICPHLNSHRPSQILREQEREQPNWYSLDFELIRACGAMVMLPGWEHSPGCVEEYALAVQLGMPVYFWAVQKHREKLLKRKV